MTAKEDHNNQECFTKLTLRHKAKALTKEEVEKGRSKAYEYLDLQSNSLQRIWLCVVPYKNALTFKLKTK